MNTYKSYRLARYDLAQKTLFYQGSNNKNTIDTISFLEPFLSDLIFEMQGILCCVKVNSCILYLQFKIFRLVDEANTIPP